MAKKDFNLPKHADIDTKNLFVIKALQSLDSRGFVKTQFSWQYYYYTLTPEVRFTLCAILRYHNTNSLLGSGLPP